MDQQRKVKAATTMLVESLQGKSFINPADYSVLYDKKALRKNEKPGNNIDGFAPTHSHILTKSLKALGHKPVKHWVMTPNGMQWQHAFPEEVVCRTIRLKDNFRDKLYKPAEDEV